MGDTKGPHIDASEVEPTYFGLQAYWGATKHMGGLKVTKELIELCQLRKGQHVLDVGCGVGVTPCYLAKKIGCRAMGVDISDMMIRRAKERAEREGITGLAEFRVADVQDLPFEEGSFDVVIGESVLVFAKDKERALRECVRVTRPGGCVGMTESTWLKRPTPEMVEYASRTWDIPAEILDREGWVRLMIRSGLSDVRGEERSSRLTEYVEEIRRYGLADYVGMLYRAVELYVKNPAFRQYVKGRHTSLPKDFLEHLGYGIYVGKK